MHKDRRILIYVLGFLTGFHIALPAYITSSFLNTFVSLSTVGAIFSFGYALSIVNISFLPRILKKLGSFWSLLAFLFIELVAILTLAFSSSTALIIGAQIVSITAAALIGLPLDVFLERYSKESSTGGIRGTYLLFINTAWVLSQVMVALFILDSQYRAIFLVAALMLIPVLIITLLKFSDYKDRKYLGGNPFHAFSSASKDPGVFNILTINFLLQFFFSWMVIYTPIYLHQYIGFEWKEIGIMFSIMLLPFIIFELPLGKIADKYLGEKEILTVGFIIMAIASLYIGFADSKSFLIWTGVLFLSRIGAAMIEAMCETYFFRNVKDTDLGYISLFRSTRPWAYVVAPILATIIIPIAGINSLFFVLFAIMLYALRFVFKLQDSK